MSVGLFDDFQRGLDVLKPGGETPNWDYALGRTALDVALVPAAPLYVLGAGVNDLSGGSSNYNPWSASRDSAGTTYSPLTQALSGYQGDTPGAGTWSFPVVNPSTPRVVYDFGRAVVDPILPDLGNLGKSLIVPAALIAAAFAFGGSRGRR